MTFHIFNDKFQGHTANAFKSPYLLGKKALVLTCTLTTKACKCDHDPEGQSLKSLDKCSKMIYKDLGFISRFLNMLSKIVLTCVYMIHGTKCDLDLLPYDLNVGQKNTNILKLLYFTINWS